MRDSRTLIGRFSRLSAYEKAVVALSAALGVFLILDPLVLSAVRGLDPDLRRFFRLLTDLGDSNWILIPSGAGLLILAWLQARERRPRRGVIYGYVSKLLVFLFVTVALSGLTASLTKNVIGRARPKLYDELGSLEFRPFSFDYGFAAFPSGHATTIGALAGVLAIVWPCARMPVFVAGAWIASTRFLIGAHYFTDAMAGYALGLAFAYFLRDRLARRGWLFRTDPKGDVRLRGRTLLRAATNALSGKLLVLGSSVLRLVRSRGEPRH